jgi:hypothetical protein
MSDGRKAWGTTVFCDDIRQEVGGKVSLIGIYAGDMNVHVDFPYVAPKFGLWIKYFEVPDTHDEDAKLRVYLPGEIDPSIEADIPLREVRNKTLIAPPSEQDSEQWLMLQMPILVTPLVLRQPGQIKVRLEIGGEVVRLGTLAITHSPPQPSEG